MRRTYHGILSLVFGTFTAMTKGSDACRFKAAQVVNRKTHVDCSLIEADLGSMGVQES